MTNLTVVTIRTEAGVRTFRIRSEGHTPEHVLGVLGPAVMLGCGMLDAVYSQSDEPEVERKDGMGQD